MAEAALAQARRLVRCPHCGAILPGVTDIALGNCGSCGAVLEATERIEPDPMDEDLISVHPIGCHSEEPCKDRIDPNQIKTELTDPVQTGIGQINAEGVEDVPESNQTTEIKNVSKGSHTSSSKKSRFPGCPKGTRRTSALCINDGGGRRCQHPACTRGARGSTLFCMAHGGGRRCEYLGCSKNAKGRTDFCIAHGGGRRCSHEDCMRTARGKSGFCMRHGGGKRCQVENCTKIAGPSGFCISHGGRRCQYPGCSKGPHGSTFFCVAHGGRKRCVILGCTKSARGRTTFCVRHGGLKRCTFDGCGRSAIGSSDFCVAHGRGKTCSWGHPGSEWGLSSDPCMKLARGKIGICASHSALVPELRGLSTSASAIKESESNQHPEMRQIPTVQDMNYDDVEIDDDRIDFSSSSSNYFGLQTFDLSLRIGPPSLKTSFSAPCSVPLSPEHKIALFSGGEEQHRNKRKRQKILSDDEKTISAVSNLSILPTESSADPVQTLPPAYSFPNFPEHVKVRCIQHCSLFPRDSEFERDKLVQLWVAEECIDTEVSQRLEDVANSYFDALVDEEIIIPSAIDNFYGKEKYKVNASKVPTWFQMQGGYLRIDEGKLHEFKGAFHLSLHCKNIDWTMYDTLKHITRLRTLTLSHGGPSIKELPSDLFLGLKDLRTLDLSFTHLSDVPNSIGNLESLRYLDLSETPIMLLPESTDRLSLLQTLRLKGCSGVHALPKKLRELTNLRHLDLDIVQQLDSMPKGMGSLVKLQTLNGFLVGTNSGYGIRELKNMNDITGSFCISGLENVSSADDAKEAALSKKKYINTLELRWYDHGIVSCVLQNEILKHLEPHFGLKQLKILFYGGSELPSWISNPSFANLESITLYNCIHCQTLPSIGKLPSLKFLGIVGMDNVIDIKISFYRDDGILNIPAFPSLEKLTIDNMLNLQTWTEFDNGDFPCLQHISIRDCPKLSSLPKFSYLSSLLHLEISDCMQLISFPEGGFPNSLESLIVTDCPGISDWCLKHGGEGRSKIQHVRNVWIDFKEIVLDSGFQDVKQTKEKVLDSGFQDVEQTKEKVLDSGFQDIEQTRVGVWDLGFDVEQTKENVLDSRFQDVEQTKEKVLDSGFQDIEKIRVGAWEFVDFDFEQTSENLLDSGFQDVGQTKEKVLDSGIFVHKQIKEKTTRTIRVEAISSNIADTPPDGYCWRKYGQKIILGSSHPRLYYRCSSVRGCPARKHVQREDNDPTMLLVTYTGEHSHTEGASQDVNIL